MDNAQDPSPLIQPQKHQLVPPKTSVLGDYTKKRMVAQNNFINEPTKNILQKRISSAHPNKKQIQTTHDYTDH